MNSAAEKNSVKDSQKKQDRTATRIPVSILCLVLASQVLSPSCTSAAKTGGCRARGGSFIGQNLSTTGIGDVPPPAPTGLGYPSPSTFIVGDEIEALVPTFVGGGLTATFTVQPNLPPGLGISFFNGRITGTPQAASPAITYTVTAANESGSDSATLQIQVVQPFSTPLAMADPTPQSMDSGEEMAPRDLLYPRIICEYTVGEAIEALVPTHVGGAIQQYSVSPPFPRGLSVDPIGGTISGTPREAVEANVYTVVGSNSCGSSAATIRFAVIPH